MKSERALRRAASRANGRPKGKARQQLIKEIVATDSTFVFDDNPSEKGEDQWVGKCIHCNSNVVVLEGWRTTATIEHISPISSTEDANDIKNLALACPRCNNKKGIHHDQHAGKGGRADEVIAALKEKRMRRWRTALG